METADLRDRTLKNEGQELAVLIELGLTPKQAEVYLSLIYHGAARITEIANNIGAARSEVLRVIAKLEKLGLVVKRLSTPPSYAARPLADGIKILAEQREHVLKKIMKEAKKVIQNHEKSYRGESKPAYQTEPNYSLTKGSKAETLRMEEVLKNTKKTNHSICDWRVHLFTISQYPELWEESLKKGVAYRILCNVPENQKLPDILSALMAKGDYEIRRTSSLPPVLIAIIDGEWAGIITFKEGAVGQSMSNILGGLWSDNKDIITTMEDYFSIKWKQASPVAN